MADYSVHDWTITMLGVPVDGLSDDNDAVTFPQDRELTTHRVGAKGDVAFFSSPHRKTGPLMIKLMPDSPSAKMIGLQIENWLSGGEVNWDSSAYNRRTHLRVSMTNGRPQKAPVSPNIGPEPANLTFEFFYQDMKPDWSQVVQAV